VKRCVNCLLPAGVSDSDLDHAGVCQFCRSARATSPTSLDAADLTAAYRKDLERALVDCRGKGDYDCLVPLSGGKDSCYLLYKLKVEYGLNVLAFTVDANLSELAWQNIRMTTEKLQIEHLSYSPSREFYRKAFRYLLRNQEARRAVYTVTYGYAPLFEGDRIKLAIAPEFSSLIREGKANRTYWKFMAPDRLFDHSKVATRQAHYDPHEGAGAGRRRSQNHVAQRGLRACFPRLNPRANPS
jgi:hypothetical protein